MDKWYVNFITKQNGLLTGLDVEYHRGIRFGR